MVRSIGRRSLLGGAAAGIGLLAFSGARLTVSTAPVKAAEVSFPDFARMRQEKFAGLPPDGNRTLHHLVPKEGRLRLSRVRNGDTIGFETGGVWNRVPELKGLRGVTVTAYGDRTKPWPKFVGGKEPFRLLGCSDCVVEFLEAAEFRGNCWQSFDSKDIVFRYVIGHSSGRVRGKKPSSNNRGHAFSLRGSRSSKFTLLACEGYDMAEDGFQAGSDVRRATVLIDGCYFHDNIEDGVDIKAGDIEIVSTRLENNGSKGLVSHGDAGRIRARRTRFAGSKLNDGISVDGRGGSLGRLKGALRFEDCEVFGNNGWGLIAKRTQVDIVLRNTRFRNNKEGSWRSGAGHVGEVVVV